MKRSSVHNVPRRAVVALVLVSLGIPMCTLNPDRVGAEDRAKSTETITVAFAPDPSWAQVPVAQAIGAFDAEGVEVKIVTFPTGIQTLDALKAGVVDVATSGDFPSAAAISKDSRIRIIADGSRWKGSGIVARKSSGIAKFDDLADKKVGMPLGTTANYFAMSALNAGGIKVKIVNVRPPEAVAAITTGQIDAMAVFQPTKAKVIEALDNDAIVLPSPGDRYIQHSLYLALDETIKSKRKAITSLLKAIKRADKPLAEGSVGAVNAVMLSTNLSESITKSILAEFEFKTQLQADLARALKKLSDWAQENKLLPADQKIDYTPAIAPDLLQEIE